MMLAQSVTLYIVLYFVFVAFVGILLHSIVLHCVAKLYCEHTIMLSIVKTQGHIMQALDFRSSISSSAAL